MRRAFAPVVLLNGEPLVEAALHRLLARPLLAETSALSRHCLDELRRQEERQARERFHETLRASFSVTVAPPDFDRIADLVEGRYPRPRVVPPILFRTGWCPPEPGFRYRR